MSLPLYTHPDMLMHEPGDRHVERPARLKSVLEALADAGDLDLETREAPLVDMADLALVHPQSFIDAVVAATPNQGRVKLDPDTALSPGSLIAARRAAGAVVDAVRSRGAGRDTARLLRRAPAGASRRAGQGHGLLRLLQRGRRRPGGAEGGLAKVAVVDFDVHHGNGTQAAFETDPSLFYASIHQWPLYPGTGAASETGVGNVVNSVVGPMAPREAWRAAFERLMPAMDAFAPDLILISAGFDAHARDPLAEQALEADDYAWATRAIAEVARNRSKGRIVSSLEGGYDLEGLSQSALAHVRALGEA